MSAARHAGEPRAPRRTRDHREHGRITRRTAGLAALAVTGVLGTGLAAYALWSDSVDNSGAATIGQVGVKFERLGTTTSSATATASTSVLSAAVVKADAQAMIAATPKAVAVPLAVRVRADGNAGINYTLALGTPAAGSVLAASTLRIFPVATQADCTAAAAVTAAAAPQPSTTNVVGLAPGETTTSTASAFWCLGAVYSGTGGTYTNTATASTTFNSAPVTATDSWSAYVFAPVTVSLTHTVTTPGSP